MSSNVVNPLDEPILFKEAILALTQIIENIFPIIKASRTLRSTLMKLEPSITEAELDDVLPLPHRRPRNATEPAGPAHPTNPAHPISSARPISPAHPTAPAHPNEAADTALDSLCGQVFAVLIVQMLQRDCAAAVAPSTVGGSSGRSSGGDDHEAAVAATAQWAALDESSRRNFQESMQPVLKFLANWQVAQARPVRSKDILKLLEGIPVPPEAASAGTVAAAAVPGGSEDPGDGAAASPAADPANNVASGGGADDSGKKGKKKDKERSKKRRTESVQVDMPAAKPCTSMLDLLTHVNAAELEDDGT